MLLYFRWAFYQEIKHVNAPPLFYYRYYQIKSNVKSREFAVVSQSACGIVGIAPDGVERAEDAHLTLTL